MYYNNKNTSFIERGAVSFKHCHYSKLRDKWCMDLDV
jgi:hypothetical protein